MRNLAGDMVENMGLRDTVGGVCSNPTHDATEVTKKVAVQGCKSATGESEFGSAVVGKKRVGVLEESDQDQPVVDPEVRDTVETEHIEETVLVNESANDTHPDRDTNDRDDNLAVVVRGEHRRAGYKVYHSMSMTTFHTLTRGTHDWCPLGIGVDQKHFG